MSVQTITRRMYIGQIKLLLLLNVIVERVRKIQSINVFWSNFFFMWIASFLCFVLNCSRFKLNFFFRVSLYLYYWPKICIQDISRCYTFAPLAGIGIYLITCTRDFVINVRTIWSFIELKTKTTFFQKKNSRFARVVIDLHYRVVPIRSDSAERTPDKIVRSSCYRVQTIMFCFVIFLFYSVDWILVQPCP